MGGAGHGAGATEPGELPRAIQLLAAAEKNNMSNKSIHYRLLILYRKTGNLAQVQAENKWLRSASW